VKQVKSKGKFTYIELEDGTAIGITYGMTGNIRTDDSKHNAVEFRTAENTFYYHSTRHFGHVTGLTSEDLTKKLNSLGYDILDSTVLDRQTLVTTWRKKNGLNICRLLLEEQGLVCGIGNYIKSEILYHTGVYPFCEASKLTDDTLYELYLKAREIGEAAYTDGGASLYTYTGLTGDKSPFKLKLAVYDREMDPEGYPVTRSTTPDKRSTFWVEDKQKCGSVLAQPVLKVNIKPKVFDLSKKSPVK
jgi:formamidopyrimidine-DNA glycosylase